MEGGPGRSPRAMAVPGTSGSAVAVATPRLQVSHRVAGERRGEGEGSGEGRGGARLSVPCACAEKRRVAPRALLSAGSAPTGRLAPPLDTAASRRRREGSPSARRPLQRPLGPAARRWPPATSGAPRARTRRAPNVPRLCTPALHARGRAAPPRPAQRPAAVGRVFSRSIAPRSPRPSLPEPPPPLKSAINFPSLPPPRSAPATQTPPPDAPSRAPSSPAPACRAAPRRPPLPGCAPGSRGPLPDPRSDPREPREARPGSQGMNISVLAKLPSADVMAPAAVATRRIPPRGREDARGSGPRCVLEPCPAGPSALPERGAQRGGGLVGFLPAPRLRPNRERLLGSRSQRADPRPR